MRILDSQGRLFGKISVLDLGAALVILMVIVGIFFVPGTTGSVAQVNVTTKPVEVDLIVRGLSVRDPQGLLQQFRDRGKTNIIIRNQPYGEVDVIKIEQQQRTLAVTQPDGTLKAMPDPRQEESFSTNLFITLGGKAQITNDGPVLGNSKLKIGTPVELEGPTYNFNASVIDVRVK